MKSSINTNTISLNGRTVLSSPVMDRDVANKAMAMINGIARRNNIAIYNTKLEKLGYFNKKAVAKKDTKKPINKEAKKGTKALEYLAVVTTKAIDLKEIGTVVNDAMAYLLGAVKESAKSVVGAVTRKARKVADKVKMAIDSLPIRSHAFGSLVSKAPRVYSNIGNMSRVDEAKSFARSLARQFTAINKAIESKMAKLESLSLVDYSNMSVDSTLANTKAICKCIDMINRLKEERKDISYLNMQIRQNFKFYIRDYSKNTKLQLLASRSASTSNFNLDSNNVDIDNNDVNDCNGVIANGSASVGKIKNTKGEDTMNILTMNLQLLAANKGGDIKGFTKRDFTNVPNAAEVIQKKWSVLSNKLKGRMLGLVIKQNKTDKSIGVTEMIVPLQESMLTRHLTGKVGTITIGDAVHTFNEEDRFVDEYITVSFDSATSQLYSRQALYMDITRGIIAFPEVDGESVVYRNIRTGRLVKPERLNKYVLALATASGLRGKKNLYNAVFVKLEDGETIASKMLNPLLHNIVKHANKSMTREQAAKFMSRPGLASTGSTAVCPINCLAHFNGVFDYSSKRNTFDGIAFACAKFIARAFGITEDEACKLSLQARPGGVIKVQIKVLPTALFNAYVGDLKAKDNLEVHGAGEIEFLYDNNSIKAKIDVTDIKLEVLAVGRMSEVALSKQIIEKLFLEAAIIDRTNGNSDKTNEVVDFITTLGQTKISSLMNELISSDGKISPDVDYVYDIINKISRNKIPAAKKSAMANTLRSIATLIDKLSFTDGNMFYNVIYTDTAQIFGYKIINDGEIFYPSMKNIDGKKGVMFKYPSMGGKEFYSFKTISYDTICKRINSIEGISSKLRKALIEDYKKMSNALVVLPASREVFDSCAGLDIDMDAAALVFTDLVVELLHGKEEHVILNAKETKTSTNKSNISDSVKNKADQYLKEMFEKSMKNKGDNCFASQLINGNTYNPAKDDFFGKMFNIATTGDIKSVGEITIDNNKTIAVATEAVKGNFKPIMALIKENIGRTSGVNAEYKGLPLTDNDSIELSELTIDNMIKEIRNLKLTPEVLIRVALDINRCFRLYQETTIDAAKTGLMIAIAIMVNSIELKSLQKVKFVEKTDSSTGIVTYHIEREIKEIKTKAVFINKKKVYIDPILIEDSMSKIQDELIDFTMAIKESLERDYNLYSFLGESSKQVDGSMDAQINSALAAFRSNFPAYAQGLIEIKAIYGVLVGEYTEALNKLDNEESSEEERAILKSQFKLKLANLSNTVERYLSFVKGRSPQSIAMNKGAILIAIGALTSKGTVSANNANKFAFNIASHYALSYALASDRYVAECEVLHCAKDVEGEVEVTNGFADDNSLIVKESFKDRKDGKATLKVRRFEDGSVKVAETKYIEIPEVDESKTSLVLDAKLSAMLNARKEAVLDASGSKIMQAVCEAGRVLKAIEYKLFAVKDKEGNVKFTFDLNGEERSLIIPQDKIRLNDMKTNAKYSVPFGYIVGDKTDKKAVVDGKVVLELTK